MQLWCFLRLGEAAERIGHAIQHHPAEVDEFSSVFFSSETMSR